jgi:hypothetical protein
MSQYDNSKIIKVIKLQSESEPLKEDLSKVYLLYLFWSQGGECK